MLGARRKRRRNEVFVGEWLSARHGEDGTGRAGGGLHGARRSLVHAVLVGLLSSAMSHVGCRLSLSACCLAAACCAIMPSALCSASRWARKLGDCSSILDTAPTGRAPCLLLAPRSSRRLLRLRLRLRRAAAAGRSRRRAVAPSAAAGPRRRHRSDFINVLIIERPRLLSI